MLPRRRVLSTTSNFLIRSLHEQSRLHLDMENARINTGTNQPYLDPHSVSRRKAFAGGRVGRLLASWAPTPNTDLQPLTSGFCLLHARATDVCTIYTVRDEGQASGHANRGTSMTH